MSATFHTRYTDPPSHIVGERVRVMPALVDEGRQPVDEAEHERLSEADRERTPVRVRRPVRVVLPEDEVRRRRPAGVTDIVLHNGRSPGDLVLMTGVVRALHEAHPRRYRTLVESRFPEVWANNPNMTPEADLIQPQRVEWDWLNYGPPHDRHLSHVWRDDLARLLGVDIPMPDVSGSVYLSEAERAWPTDLLGPGPRPFVLVNSGVKADMPAKGWGRGRYQAVVDRLRGDVEFVQIGAATDQHAPLSGAFDLLGRTSIRDLIRLVYWSDLVLCPITFVMHLAAAVPTRDGGLRPCVTIAGGLEPPVWIMYSGHTVLSAVGRLPCCRTTGCCKPLMPPYPHPDNPPIRACERPVWTGQEYVGHCMDLIEVGTVVDAIRRDLSRTTHTSIRP